MSNKFKVRTADAEDLLAEVHEFLAETNFDFSNGVISSDGIDEGVVIGNTHLLRLMTDIELFLRDEEFHLGGLPGE